MTPGSWNYLLRVAHFYYQQLMLRLSSQRASA